MNNKKYFCVTYFMTSGEQDIVFKELNNGEDHTGFKAKILGEVIKNEVVIINQDDYLFARNIERVTFEGPFTTEELQEMYEDYNG